MRIGNLENDTDLQNRFKILDTSTGEILEANVFYEKSSEQGWERAYIQTLCDYLGVTGNATVKILTYLIKKKDSQNRIIGTHQMIADGAGSSLGSVDRIMKRLKDDGYIATVTKGVYMLTPYMLRYGARTQGAALLRVWDNLVMEEEGDLDEC
ncbi:MAG: hypothetical protein HOH55_05325 [Candidatus Marinimicrobia bacterium]|jgi:hypothetical protein|nr:hypothetical protein [Candidatus Neomarinimicrobiota bacterium]